MSEAIGTCGHKLRGVSDNVLIISEYSMGERVLCTVCVCDKCAKEYEDEGIILHTPEEEQKWLYGDEKENDDKYIMIERSFIEEMITAIDDWIHQYASDLCDKKYVKETSDRFFDSGGTLAYQTHLIDKLKKLIKE